MIHTFDLSYKFASYDEYNESYNRMKKYSRQKKFNLYPSCNDNNYKAYVTNVFAKQGIIVRFTRQRLNNSSFIELSVNAPKLMGIDPEVLFSNTLDYNNVINLLINRIKMINDIVLYDTFKLPEGIDEWKTKRVDYMVDIPTDNVQYYIYLFNKGHIPKGFKIEEYYTTSLAASSEACNLNFYNKTQQLKDVYDIIIPQNILRLEVQCKAKMIRAIKKEYNLHGNSFDLFCNRAIAFKVIAEQVKNIIGIYDFYKYDCMRDKVINSSMRFRKQMQCLKLIKAISDTNFTSSEIMQLSDNKVIDSEEWLDLLKETFHRHKLSITQKRIAFVREAIKGLSKYYERSYLSELELSPIALPDSFKGIILINPIKLIPENLFH